MTTNLSLPDDFIEAVTEQVCKLNDNYEADALIEREIGALVDEWIPHLEHGQKMDMYQQVANIVRQTATRPEHKKISPRTIRHWRRVFGWCSKYGSAYNELPGSLINVAIQVADIANLTPSYVCDWLINTGTRSEDALWANFLPTTSNGYEADHPVISGLLRGINKNWQQHSRFPRLIRLVNLLRAEIKAIQERT